MKTIAAAVLIGALVWCALFHLIGCATPKTGTPCPTADAAYCADAGVVRTCQGGVLVDYPCNGPKGCSVDQGRNVFCDQGQRAIAGQPCFPVYEGTGACAQDGNSLLQCTSGLWTAVACPQGKTCHVDAAGVLCR